MNEKVSLGANSNTIVLGHLLLSVMNIIVKMSEVKDHKWRGTGTGIVQ